MTIEGGLARRMLFHVFGSDWMQFELCRTGSVTGAELSEPI